MSPNWSRYAWITADRQNELQVRASRPVSQSLLGSYAADSASVDRAWPLARKKASSSGARCARAPASRRAGVLRPQAPVRRCGDAPFLGVTFKELDARPVPLTPALVCRPAVAPRAAWPGFPRG